MLDEAHPVGPLVLVAEDDADLRELFRDLLDDDGYRTVVAIDGAGALDLARSSRTARPLLGTAPDPLVGRAGPPSGSGGRPAPGRGTAPETVPATRRTAAPHRRDFVSDFVR